MRGINNRIYGTELVNHCDPLARAIDRKVRNKQAAGPIFLRRERTLCKVERKVFEEPAVIVEGFRLSAAHWIDGYAKAWRPFIRQSVVRAGATRARTADHV